MDYEAEYEGYRGVSYVKSIYIFHGFQIVRSSSQGIKEYELSLRSPFTRKTLFSFSCVVREITGVAGSLEVVVVQILLGHDCR